MAEQRHLLRLNRSIVVALPPTVLLHLGVARGAGVYWFTTRKGEAVLATRASRQGGHPEGLSLQRQLSAALLEIAHLKQRNEARDRSLYAEGHHHGYRQAEERLSAPTGPSARRGVRRRLYAYGLPRVEAAPSKPRTRRAPRATEVVTLPEHDPPYADDFDGQGQLIPREADAIPRSDLPSSPAVVAGEAGTPGMQSPGAPNEH
jgi:hypothetical protein